MSYTDCGGTLHFSSTMEAEKYCEANSKKKSDQWFVSCTAYGEMRRSRYLFSWERAAKENLFMVLVEIEDTIVIETKKNLNFRIKVKNIPVQVAHSIWLNPKTVLTVFDDFNKNIPISNIGLVKRIFIENDSRGVRK
jgi:hypothetical protein